MIDIILGCVIILNIIYISYSWNQSNYYYDDLYNIFNDDDDDDVVIEYNVVRDNDIWFDLDI